MKRITSDCSCYKEMCKSEFDELVLEDNCISNSPNNAIQGHTILLFVTEDWENEGQFNFQGGLYAEKDEKITLYHPNGYYDGFLDDSYILMEVSHPTHQTIFFMLDGEPASMYERVQGIEESEGSHAGYEITLDEIKAMLKANSMPYYDDANIYVIEAM